MGNYIDAKNELYEQVEICGKQALFTSARVNRETLPDGVYGYDLRHDDECQGEVCEVKKFVLVNHWGTVLLTEEIDLGEDGYLLLNEGEDFGYLGVSGLKFEDIYDLKTNRGGLSCSHPEREYEWKQI